VCLGTDASGQPRITVGNPGYERVVATNRPLALGGWSLVTVFQWSRVDSDGDGLDDGWEIRHFGDLLHDGDADTDGDGLSDDGEYGAGTDPNATDTDGDGLTDGQEVYTTGSDPLVADTDGDTLPDGFEARTLGLDPLTPDDPEGDLDGDGLTNAAELALGTSADDADSDGDGLEDGAEVTAGTDPLDSDTDGDGLMDGVETGTAVFVSASDTGTDPLDPDTDADRMADGWEVTYGLDPLADDAQGDPDQDGAPNLLEFRLRGSPSSADTPVALLAALWQVSALWPLSAGFADTSGHGLDLVAHGDAAVTGGLLTLAADGYAELASAPPDLAAAPCHTFSLWFESGATGTLIAASPAGAAAPALVLRLDAGGGLVASVSGTDPAGQAQTVTAQCSGVGPGWHQALLCFRERRPPVLYLDGLQVQGAAWSTADAMLLGADLNRILVGAAPGPEGVADLLSGSVSAVAWLATAVDSQAAGMLFRAGRDYDLAPLRSSDGDSDGMPDAWECRWLLSLARGPTEDTDGDGLANLQEYLNGCDPLNRDTDGDGLGDGDEVSTYGTDPLLADTDGDGLSDWQEVNQSHTDPTLADTDGDGLTDGWEVAHGLSPLLADSDADGIADGSEDSDDDGLSDLAEFGLGTDPRVADVGSATVAFQAASTSAYESATVVQVQLALSELPPYRQTVTVRVQACGGTASPGTDYQFTDADVTFSQGALTATASVQLLTDTVREPTESLVLRLNQPKGARLGSPAIHTILMTNALSAQDDTDGDGLPDAWEMQYFGNLDQTAAGDPDADGLTNLQEYQMGARPDKGFRAGLPGELKLRVTGMGR